MTTLTDFVDPLKTLTDEKALKLIGLDKEPMAEDDIGHRLNHILAVCDEHLLIPMTNFEEELTPCWDNIAKDLRKIYKVKVGGRNVFNIVVEVMRVRYYHWRKNGHDFPDEILKCNIDLAFLQIASQVGAIGDISAIGGGPPDMPAELKSAELVADLIQRIRHRREQLIAEPSMPSQASSSELPEANRVAPLQPFTDEENQAVFNDPELNEMIEGLGDLIRNS